MRVLTFVLMLTVAIGGSLLGYRLITGRDLIGPSDLGFTSPPGVAAELSAATPTLGPTPEPTPTLRPTSTPPAATPIPRAAEIMLVGNTDGQGVFMRKTPIMSDRLKVYPERTRMEVLEKNIEGDGRKWMRVRAPDGAEGFIPESYLVRL